ncbi:SKI family transcriptional corepressor 1 like protein [Argiope bruennichi]|uniref:SKI family transcriptional corepressor 1 like protein n=1 Tax=Argiope bruennichi TaxID=94029 RepID=A0A8T0FSU7_ARGBR|nr:SKI family transcriptional corepressor 1 like protein [Argiope bruennichi]
MDTDARGLVFSESKQRRREEMPSLIRTEKLEAADSPDSKHGGKSDDSPLLDSQRFSSLSKDELKEVLLQEAEARRRAEREYQAIRDTFEEQVRKEIAYREEVAKQLQIVREAHDALHHFSCKMLASRHCTECGYKPTLPE